MTENRIEIGKRIRNFRTGSYLTQAQFAESLDVSTNFISEVETGKKNISLDTLCRMCKQYRLSADYILFGKENSSTAHSTLSQFLSPLSIEDSQTVINYLEASIKLKKIDRELSSKNPST